VIKQKIIAANPGQTTSQLNAAADAIAKAEREKELAAKRAAGGDY